VDIGPVIEIINKHVAPNAVPLLKYQLFWRLLRQTLTTLHDLKQKTAFSVEGTFSLSRQMLFFRELVSNFRGVKMYNTV
jgi:hypothetical protein